MRVKPYLAAKHRAIAAATNAFTGEPPKDAIASRTNFLKFREFVCGHETYPHQELWHRELNTGRDSRYLSGIAGDDVLILAPRGSSKSTFLIEWIAWAIGVHTSPEHKLALKILYISYEKTTSQQKSQQIQRVIESIEYRQVFPWVKKGPNWAKGMWEIDFIHAGIPTASEPYTLVCTGLNGTATSKRSHLLVFDDLIKDPESITNPMVREAMISVYESAIKPTRFDGSRAVCLGTRMRPDDIYCSTFIEAKGWRVIEQSAIVTDEDGKEKSYWEPLDDKSPGQPLEMLRKLREESPITFSYQYQNKVVRLDTQSIDPTWIKRDYLPSKLDRLVLGLDLSAGLRETNDYTAMVLGGFKQEFIDGKSVPRFYIIDAERVRVMGNIEKLDLLMEIYENWKHLNSYLEVAVETNGYQLSLSGDFETYLISEHEYYDVGIIEMPSSRDKLSRLRGITGLFQNDLVRFNHYCRNFAVLHDELCEFGSQPHDDMADALVLCLQGLRHRRTLDSAEYETRY